MIAILVLLLLLFFFEVFAYLAKMQRLNKVMELYEKVLDNVTEAQENNLKIQNGIRDAIHALNNLLNVIKGWSLIWDHQRDRAKEVADKAAKIADKAVEVSDKTVEAASKLVPAADRIEEAANVIKDASHTGLPSSRAGGV